MVKGKRMSPRGRKGIRAPHWRDRLSCLRQEDTVEDNVAVGEDANAMPMQPMGKSAPAIMQPMEESDPQLPGPLADVIVHSPPQKASSAAHPVSTKKLSYTPIGPVAASSEDITYV